MSDTILTIARTFPVNTKITSPDGGTTLWIQLDDKIDILEVFREAVNKKISFLPGRICSTTPEYNNCMRISCGKPFDKDLEKGLTTLGEIIKKQLTIIS